MIKQTIPAGWVKSPLNIRDLDSLKITHKTIVTDWLYSNRHAQPVETTIIHECDYEKAKLTADYYSRIKASKARKRPQKLSQVPDSIIELYKSRIVRLPLKKSENARHKLHLKINRMKREWPQLANIL